MLLRAARPVFVALDAIRNCSSRGRPLKRNCSFIGFLCHRGFSATRGVCQSNMESRSNGPALVAVCQMNSTNDVDRNLGICEDLVRKAKSRGAKVRFLCSHMRKAILYSILGPVLQPLLNPRPPPPPHPPALVTRTLPSPSSTIHLTRVIWRGMLFLYMPPATIFQGSQQITL